MRVSREPTRSWAPRDRLISAHLAPRVALLAQRGPLLHAALLLLGAAEPREAAKATKATKGDQGDPYGNQGDQGDPKQALAA